ncbi:putative Calmodulin [Hypsibius exemplaris]|uniref:Calmodulin n=1 Tax=Hypsibius exemplaris TaxID=2072580 RepID=A0A1W0X4A2_HYPEX|nr:putative Calmodulin [Hypsibius exemplaris]
MILISFTQIIREGICNRCCVFWIICSFVGRGDFCDKTLPQSADVIITVLVRVREDAGGAFYGLSREQSLVWVGVVGDVPPIMKMTKNKEPTEKQISEFKESFDHFDRNGDHYITIKELKHVMEKLGFKPTASELKSFMDEADHDRNGKIDFPEFLAVMKTKMHDMMRIEELEKAFRVFDFNGDGKISRAELRKVFQNLDQHFEEDQISEMITVADMNRDGFIDFDEFSALVLSQF